VICDLDGTLVDTRDGIVDTFQAVLRLAGYAPPPREEILPFIGLPLDFMFRHFLTRELAGRVASPVAAKEQLLARAVPELIVAYRRRYHELVTPNTRAYPEVADALSELRARGLLLAVATSKLTAIATEALSAAGLLPQFDLVYGMDAVSRPKPAPDLAEKCVDSLHGTPSRAIVVGDAVHDVEMGRAAGCATCAVTYGAQSRDELLLGRPDHLIDSFSELLPIVLTSGQRIRSAD
jgi:phosphoglycolate phosphatase